MFGCHICSIWPHYLFISSKKLNIKSYLLCHWICLWLLYRFDITQYFVFKLALCSACWHLVLIIFFRHKIKCFFYNCETKGLAASRMVIKIRVKLRANARAGLLRIVLLNLSFLYNLPFILIILTQVILVVIIFKRLLLAVQRDFVLVLIIIGNAHRSRWFGVSDITTAGK